MSIRDLLRRLRASTAGPPHTGAVLGMNRRNAEFVYPLNKRRDFPIADDKVLAKQLLAQAGIPVPATLEIVRGFFGIDSAAAWLTERGEAVIKPSRGRVGSGVMVLRSVDARTKTPSETRTRIRQRMADILSGVHSGGESDVVLIEERLRPHPALAHLWAHDIVDIRVIVHRARPTMAMLRVPTSGSGGRSNLHAGALGLAIDLETGTTSDGFWRGRKVSRHPDTQAPLAAIPLPDWPRILEISATVGHATPLGYVGVDIALDATAGPVVLEINARPGLEIQNVTGCGLRDALGATAP